MVPRALANGWDWGGARSHCLREARRLVGDQDAEEAVQEALARAWAWRESCRQQDAPLGWLLRITRNEALRLLERRRRRQAREVSPSTPADHPTEDLELMNAPLRLSVQRALALVPLADRELLRLHYEEELSHSEVANRLGVPYGTAKVRLHRARKRLEPFLPHE